MHFIGFRDKKFPLTGSEVMCPLLGLDIISPSSDLELISVLYRVNR